LKSLKGLKCFLFHVSGLKSLAALSSLRSVEWFRVSFDIQYSMFNIRYLCSGFLVSCFLFQVSGLKGLKCFLFHVSGLKSLAALSSLCSVEWFRVSFDIQYSMFNITHFVREIASLSSIFMVRGFLVSSFKFEQPRDIVAFI
jgi:hypothetical protein